jgi:hypothetical protein
MEAEKGSKESTIQRIVARDGHNPALKIYRSAPAPRQ